MLMKTKNFKLQKLTKKINRKGKKICREIQFQYFKKDINRYKKLAVFQVL